MKSWICSKPGSVQDLECIDAPAAEPTAGQVAIRVSACGINFPDVLMIQGRYQMKPPLPFAPGGEVSGTIAAIGEGVTGIAEGQRVMATVFFGGLSEIVTAPAKTVVPIPDSMDMRTASVFQGGHTTAYYGLKQRGQLKPGETLLVLGASGGVGMAAMQLGQAMGARVIGAGGSMRKADALKAMGFAEIIDLSTEDLRARLKELAPAGVDVIFDPVGGPLLEQACRSVARNSRVLIVGFASGDIAMYQTNLALLKESSVVGVNYQSFFQHEPAAVRQNFAELFEMYENGSIKPVIERVFAFNEAKDAFAAMSSRSIVGKVLVDVQS